MNLFVFTAGFALCWMLCGKLVIDAWRCARAPDNSLDHDGLRSPIMLHRIMGALWSFAFGLRCGSEAQALWRWNPYDPVGTAASHVLKRVLDPIAADVGYLALAIYFLSLPGITEQLRKEPFPISMWTTLPLLKRPPVQR